MDKKCKHCAMSVPKEAKICPYCRKSLGYSLPFKPLLGLFFFVIIAALMQEGHTTGSSGTSTTTPSAAASDSPLTAKGKKIKAKHSAWSNDDCNTIAEKQIRVGMTADQVRAAWGRPYKINLTTTGSQEHEQWVMHEMGSTYVYFQDGVMTSLQQSK